MPSFVVTMTLIVADVARSQAFTATCSALR
jgi:hypothetical protein